MEKLEHSCYTCEFLIKSFKKDKDGEYKVTNARCGKKWLNSDEDEGFPFKCGCELWKISDYDKYRIRGELRYDVEEMIALLQNLLR